jgi:hypothetical protein
MKKWIVVLAAALGLQLVMAAVANLSSERYGAFEAQEKLLTFDPDAIDGVRIEAADGSVLLSRRDGRWLVPDSGDFPADRAAVASLLDKLAALEKGWPVATTGGAAKRFKVADKEFERRLTLMSGEQPAAVLYVGTSPGFRKVHVRPQGEDAVFAVSFNTWEAGAKAEDWIDKAALELEASDLERIELGGLVLERQDDKLALAGLAADEELKDAEVDRLVSDLTGLRIGSVLGTEAKPEYRQEQPVLEVLVVPKEGETLTYRFSKPEDASYYVLKRSDRPHYFKLPEFAVKPLLEASRDKLVQAKPKVEPEPAADAPAEAVSEAPAEAASEAPAE